MKPNKKQDMKSGKGHSLEEVIRAGFEERISEYRDINWNFARAQTKIFLTLSSVQIHI